MFRLTAALALTCFAFAQSTTSSPEVGTGVEQPVIDFYDSMSDYFGYSRRAVDPIAKKGIPAEQIAAVLHIAKFSRASANEVIDAHKAGKNLNEIAKQHNVKLPGNDVVAVANIASLSAYHGRTEAEIRALHEKGASFVDINQQFRRVGVKPRTETGTRSRNQ